MASFPSLSPLRALKPTKSRCWFCWLSEYSSLVIWYLTLLPFYLCLRLQMLLKHYIYLEDRAPLFLYQRGRKWRPSIEEFKWSINLWLSRGQRQSLDVSRTLLFVPNSRIFGTQFPSHCDRESSELHVETKAERALHILLCQKPFFKAGVVMLNV